MQDGGMREIPFQHTATLLDTVSSVEDDQVNELLVGIQLQHWFLEGISGEGGILLAPSNKVISAINDIQDTAGHIWSRDPHIHVWHTLVIP